MAEGVNVRISGKLRQFIEEQAGPEGLMETDESEFALLIKRKS